MRSSEATAVLYLKFLEDRSLLRERQVSENGIPDDPRDADALLVGDSSDCQFVPGSDARWDSIQVPLRSMAVIFQGSILHGGPSCIIFRPATIRFGCSPGASRIRFLITRPACFRRRVPLQINQAISESTPARCCGHSRRPGLPARNRASPRGQDGAFPSGRPR